MMRNGVNPMTWMKKHKRWIAWVLGGIMLVTALWVGLDEIRLRSAAAAGASSTDVQRIAADISNATGVKTEQILSLYKEGKSWNDIMETLKKKNLYPGEGRGARKELLAQAGVSGEGIQNLKKEGFTDEEILEARILAERVLYQLQEITAAVPGEIEDPKVLPEPVSSPDKTEEKKYREISEKFVLEDAVTFLLQLKDVFGSMEKVMNEYLLALQLELNLEEYVTDRKAYLEHKEEKSLGLDMQGMITLEKLEARLLKKIHDENDRDAGNTAQKGQWAKSDPNTVNSKDQPASPLPDIPEVKPLNPGEMLAQEIEALDPMKR